VTLLVPGWLRAATVAGGHVVQSQARTSVSAAGVVVLHGRRGLRQIRLLGIDRAVGDIGESGVGKGSVSEGDVSGAGVGIDQGWLVRLVAQPV
jgi:hypothetical protein